MKTFYIETFGCQMNAHDSEKVIGTLVSEGYTQVAEPAQADLILYNTCSIRDKAEQKVFHRLQQFKKEHGRGKVFGVLGCVAQQEGERIFERAPHVSLVAGSASYAKLPEMLVQLESGDRRVTGLRLDTEEAFDTPFTRRDNPHRAYITIIEGCDKSCAYCVVPFTRGPERSRTSASVLKEARELASMGYTEIQLLGQNVNSYRDPSPAGWDFARLLRNLAFLAGQRRLGKIRYLMLSFVVQVANFREMPAFVALGDRFRADRVRFALIRPWRRGLARGAYAKAMIWDEAHPEFESFLAVLRDPALADPRVFATDVTPFIERARGAPLDLDLAGVCKYCKAPISSGAYDWVLARIAQVPAYY